MSLSRTGLATVVALVAASLSLEAGEVESVPRIVLVAAGKPTASIVVAKKAPAVERHAARELRKYVQRMTGAELPVRTGSRGDGPSIYIGSAAPVPELDLSKSALGEDGYVVKTVGGNIVLTGARPYSCLYTVYHLLENYLGCGFFEDGDHVPRQASVAVPALNDVEKPFYKYRRFLMAGLEMYGTRWWNLEEWRRHLDWGAKKRFNVLDQQENFLEGHVKLNIWRRLGVEIEPTDWQKGQITLRKKVFEYARMLGMKIQYSCNFLETPGSHKPGGTARPQVWQWDQFIDRSPNPVPTLTNSHHGEPFPVIDPRTDFARKVIHIGVEELIKMFGTDHLYSIRQPSEDSYVGLSEKEQREVIWSMMVDMRKVIREVDPEARVEGGWYWEFSPTHVIEAQHTAIREALKMGFTYIMCPGIEPGRYRQERSYLKGNVFEGAPWWTGVIGMGAGTVNFFGDLAGTIRELQIMVNNPTAAANLEGYMVWPEALRRNIMAVYLYMRLGWEDPRTVTLEGFLRRYADARYGKKAGYLLVPALRHLTDSVYAFNSNRCGNIPLYRMLGAAGEMVELNNRNLIRFMPDTWKALRIMATQQVLLADDPLYRFDMVEVGRNYLGQKITDYVIKARRAFGRKDLESLRTWTKRAREGLDFQAKLTSAHPWFRLKTEEDWAGQWPEMFPGASNAYCNRVGRTVLYSRDVWLLDYYSDDLSELISYYYKPRVMAHLEQMLALLQKDDDQEWREALAMPSEKDTTVPHGDYYWGHRLIGPAMKNDREIVLKFVDQGYPPDEVEYYEGPIGPLVNDLIARFPLEEDRP